MKTPAQVVNAHKMGKLRIYLRANDKLKSEGVWKRMFPMNTYRHLIAEAKKAGITNASAFTASYGYSNGGRIQQQSLETDNKHMTLCVELIDERPKLEQFFATHHRLFKGKTVVYKEVEFWEI